MQYAVIYGKLGAIKRDFITYEDMNKISSAETLEELASLFSTKQRLKIDFNPGENSSPINIERSIRAAFIDKVASFLHYLSSAQRSIFEYILYRYDLYNLKILLALHLSGHDEDIKRFVYPNTPLFKRYGFLLDKSVLVDKDLLSAFKGTPIFPFLMDAYRKYKESLDMFFLDTILDDSYYHQMLEIVINSKDNGLIRLWDIMLLVRNLEWGSRMKFLHKMRREEIFYYLVLPLPGINTDTLMACFSVASEKEFINRASEFLSRFGFDKRNLDNVPDFIYDLNMWREKYLKIASKDMNINSLLGVVAWCLLQERYIDNTSSKLQSIYYGKALI